MTNHSNFNKSFILGITLVSAMGGLLFGYDWVVIGGAVNLVFTLLAMRLVDNWGRRKLMLLGASGLAFIYIFLGASYFFEWKGLVVLFLVMTAIAAYALICLTGFLFILKKLPETKGKTLEEIEKL